MPKTLLALALIGCGGAATQSPTNVTPTEPTTETTDPDFELADAEVVTFSTLDDVTLEADWYASADGAPVFVLLHMIPPGNDRTNWQLGFIERLAAQGWSVLAVDRRGGGGSEGVATEAYTGPNGRLDVEAAVRFAQDRGAGDVALIGASNGTTSLLDYTLWAGGEGHPVPVALGFMTGGTYTESQNAMDDLPALGIPAVFTYSTAERAWSVDQEPLDPGTWAFLEYDGGSHGTRMFESRPRVRGDLVDFFSPILNAE